MNNTNNVWFVTGGSTGFGRKLIEELLSKNIPVVATARNLSAFDDLNISNNKNILKVQLDVTDKKSVNSAVKVALSRFNKIDVLVNNAGYGYSGSVEESEESAVRQMFETNFWGASTMIRAILPTMRKNRKGNILNITSIGGMLSVPAYGYYNASKHALEGLSKALALEVEPFGIKITNIEPGPFRTDWAGRSQFSANHSIVEYDNTPAREYEIASQKSSGMQDGSPELAAKAFIKLIDSDNQPMHFITGKNAYNRELVEIKNIQDDMFKWSAESQHLDYGDELYWL
ncbi:oxidoreductase [Leuconostoc carnosum]|uniref:oxidoreductase n=1 Tax=Leuconostoc carnosum TaxID=1252 RepID=UPI00123847B2|nr:oxidoreductase [Leuconostoc carnosum]KAA8367426.1 SDR family NAD(P)-dependent oxidoreductase [Leuconostoc carnosum]MBB6432958.1 NAD(P)-dependent dehydrogenase (short-subunit alcohol dehydrogenase family) [Leuconostoc carnosum]WLC59343.1 SDR family NAD(P)-dependent oxidoreductase [Leuconostoc carnosum]WLC97056.1 oxidoreductase [Leuconostoc carnosum]